MTLEPIAIIGIGCRFPGADHPEAFWHLLQNGVDAITEVPASRWEADRFYDPDPTKPDKTNTRWGGFLNEIDRFDPQFFGISPREAVSIDPQQRLLLEVAWESLEDAGQIPAQLAGTQTGVFVGIGTHDYSVLLWQHLVNDPYATTGTGNCIAANRISYTFDLKGPSLAIDTACSSSLVAVHLACQSLWRGESTLALAGGVNVLLLPSAMVGFTKSGLMAADGRCKTFDARADGYVRSEGAGMVVLKPLSQAQADGDRVYASIRGGAINQDGRSNGLTAPNPQAQEAVLREAYRQAGVSPAQVQYVEVHGTGTKLGDAMEAKALGNVLGANRSLANRCAIGSVKTNIGHTETASGIASLIKVALSMHHQQIPPSLHFQTPNPHIDFAKLPLHVQQTLTDWRSPAIAGVSSFGFGGTNAHLVLESAPARSVTVPVDRDCHLLTLSAKSEPALRELAQRYQTFLHDRPISLADLCFTANTRRSLFPHRLTIVTASIDQLKEQLDAVVNQREAAGVIYGQAVKKLSPAVGAKPVLLEDLWRSSLPDSNWQSRLERLSELYVQGATIDWAGFEPSGQMISLPTYPFERDRFWWQASGRSALADQKLSSPENLFHPLLGQQIQLAGTSEIRFHAQITSDSPIYLGDHLIADRVIFPASAYVEMALAAGKIALKSDRICLEKVAIEQPLILLEKQPKDLQLVLNIQGEDHTFQIFSSSDRATTWTLHTTGKIALAAEMPVGLVEPQAKLQAMQEVSIADHYQTLQSQGLQYGSSFRGIQKLWAGNKEALAQIQLPASLEADSYQLHPVLLDASFQTLGAIFADQTISDSYLPVGFDRLEIYAQPDDRLWSWVKLQDPNHSPDSRLTAEVTLFKDDGSIVAEAKVSLRSRTSKQSASAQTDLYEIAWEPKPHVQQAQAARDWLIFADAGGIGAKLAQLLREKHLREKHRCILVYPGEYAVLGDNEYRVDPAQPEDFRQLLQAIPQGLRRNIEGKPSELNILYLWSLEDAPVSMPTVQTGCGGVLHLVQALIETKELPHLWLVTRSAQAVETLHSLQVQHAPLWGLARSIRLEQPGDYVCIDLDGGDGQSPVRDHRSEAEIHRDVQILWQECCFADGEDQIAYRQNDRYVARLVPHAARILPPSPFRLQSGSGTLDHLAIVPGSRQVPAAGEVEIEVRAAGVNFRDVLNALGMLRSFSPANSSDLPLGGECAGIIVAVGAAVKGLRMGDEVIAAQAIGSLGSHVTVKAAFVVPKPKNFSFVEAATLPIAFLTASYGLQSLANLKAGDRVLIHAAAGGVGLAAVQIAQLVGAEVFATASPPKWAFLRSIGVNHIMNSRTLDFAQTVMSLTQGQGVDVVLNSLNGEFIGKSLEVLSPNGRFVELGKIGIWDRDQVRQTRPDVAYLPFDLLDVASQKPRSLGILLRSLMRQFREGLLKPLPHTVFSIDAAASAFRYMAQAKHKGKIVIAIPPAPLGVQPNSSYLVTGGLGALGLLTAQWLADRGAKFLILAGRSQPSADAQEAIGQLERSGVQVRVVQADVADYKAVTRLVKVSSGKNPFPPLRGVIHAAGVLADGTLPNQSWDSFSRVLEPKVAGAWNLHLATEKLPLDFFVCFSSIAALLGSPAQANYAAANAFLDALAHHRRSLGLPALSVNWSAWTTGMAASAAPQRNGQSPVGNHRFAARGITAIDPSTGFRILSTLLDQQATQVGVLPVDWAKFLQAPVKPFWSAVQPQLPLVETRSILQQLQATDDRPALMLSYLQTQLARILGFSSADRVDPQQKLIDLGMDSLTAVELINAMRTTLKITIPIDAAFDYPTVAALADYLLAIVFEAASQTHGKIEPLPRPLTARSNGAVQNGKGNLPKLPPQEILPEFYQFDRSPEYLHLRSYLAKFGQTGNPFFTIHDGIASDVIGVDGRELINYASYNYLGLSGDRAVAEAAKEAIDRYGTSVSASRVVSGERPIHQTLEGEIAAFLGTEACIVYIGGHTTNTTTIGHLFGKNDLILYDALSHNSIRQGCSLSGAMLLEFPHNDWQTLEQLLQQHRSRYEKVLIAIEGIYSTDGDLAPLPQIVAVKHRHKAFLLVDEAHSIGVLGRTGRGIGEHFGVKPADVDLWMGTLSKSLASCGGYIAADRAVVEYLKYTAPGFVFSVGMSPPNTAAALAALRQLQAEPDRIARLTDRARCFLTLAKQLKLNTGASANSPIVPVILGEDSKAIWLSQQLLDQGINVQPMVYPSVPHNAARLRFFLSCTHTEAQIRFTLETLAEAIDRLPPPAPLLQTAPPAHYKRVSS